MPVFLHGSVPDGSQTFMPGKNTACECSVALSNTKIQASCVDLFAKNAPPFCVG